MVIILCMQLDLVKQQGLKLFLFETYAQEINIHMPMELNKK